MKYIEFEKEIKDWAMTYGIPLDYIQYDYDNIILTNEVSGDRIAIIDWNTQYCFDMGWGGAKCLSDPARRDLFELLIAISETPPEEREDEKRFIIPLPNLVTTDGRQQYLTHKDCKFFACRRDETLQQIWKEEHLELIPKEYRQFAMELVLK